MSDKRIIEEPASEEIFHDDWLVKDSPLNETTKMRLSVFMALVADKAKEGMVPYTMLATEWTALTLYRKDQVVIYDGELYRAKDTNVSPTFNSSAWTKISFDTLYRTTLADVKNSICEEWSTSTTYTLNDCAMHEDKLYKCVVNTATVGTWVSNEWELVSIYEIIQNLPKSASDVTYDNTESGLESDNVQDALDEVAETITELSNATEVTGTASGAIATFTDGASAPLKELKVTVTPYQDLHGYDNPWVGGGGKNKFPDGTISFTKSKLYSCKLEAGTYTLSALVTSTDTDTTTCLFVVRNSNNQSLDNGRLDRDARSSATFTITEQANTIIFYASDNNTHSTDDTATWTDVQVEIGSTATTFAPYSNICPIIGWSEANVSVTGKNIFDKNTVTYETGFITATGEISTSINGYQYTSFIKVNPNTDYVFSGDIIGANLVNAVAFYDDKQNFISRFAPSANVPASFTTPSNCKYIRTNVYSLKDVNTIQLEQGTTASSYEPFGQTYTIDLGGTRYGGVVDVTNGTMDDTLDYIASYNGETLPSTWISDRDVYAEGTTPTIGAEVVYTRATPTTVQLAPTPVKSIEGVNNIFADCGDINNVEYVRNLNITINDLLSRING